MTAVVVIIKLSKPEMALPRGEREGIAIGTFEPRTCH